METEERSSVFWRRARFIDVFCINNVSREERKREGGPTTEKEGERENRQGERE